MRIERGEGFTVLKESILISPEKAQKAECMQHAIFLSF